MISLRGKSSLYLLDTGLSQVYAQSDEQDGAVLMAAGASDQGLGQVIRPTFEGDLGHHLVTITCRSDWNV